MNKIYYSYEEFKEDLKTLIKKIDQEFEVILPIARGGLSMGQMLGEYYNLREVYALNSMGYDGTQKRDEVTLFNVPKLLMTQRVLIVDDIADSGETLLEVLKVLEAKYPTIEFYTATIFYKPTSIIEPTWWVREPRGWIEFFWGEDLKN